MNLHISPLSSLNSEYIISSLTQILFLLLLHNLTTSLLVFSHLLSFQRYESTCEIFEKLISWPLLQILLLLSLYPKSPILLPSSSPSLFFLFLISFYFSLSSSSSSFFSSSFCFYYPGILYFGLHCFPHFFRHLVIFTSSILQSILGL